VPDEDFGSVRMQGVVPRFVETPGEVRHSGRALGADNDDVYLNMLGLSRTELEQLKSEGIV
jgi:crotonobetainyl-CoA:carnitine CoA-transferase CaiB-like acyl-CoA transferase